MAKKTFIIPVEMEIPQNIHMSGNIHIEAESQEEALEILETNKGNRDFLRSKVTSDDIDWSFKMDNVLEDMRCGKIKSIEHNGEDIEEE